uniref:Reverse transcriptase domain-containing protein n=1 Tax=Oncorhynchus tshawytscha TaxID=74940 RepID=A0AAZ3PI26_ONCTS
MFFKSVRARQSRKVMHGVREENGSIVREPEDMVRVTTDHFQGLFKEREIDVEQGNVFLEHLSRRLLEDIREVMEAQISLEEVESALRRMGKGKVPGMDGLPAEFYLKFWGILGPVVLEVLKAILETGVPGGSMAVGVLSLLYKKGEVTDLGNWRPLTMLCVDYKLLAKVLADRLRTALSYFVHEDQTCRVEGRSIRWNLQLIRDSIAWVEDRGLPLMVAALDQAKAFDRVNRSFLFRVLGRLGFGEKFIGWIRTLYVGAGCRVSVNSHLGDVFDLSSGVRQVCPLSALLFVLYMEPLGAAIRADHITPVLASLHWLPVKARADFKVLLLTYKALHGLAPTYLSDLVLPYIPTRTLRSQDAGLLIVPRISKQTAGGRAFSYRAPFL